MSANDLFAVLEIPLALDSAGNLFVTIQAGDNTRIAEITPGGVQSTFVSGFIWPWGLSFQPVPEPQLGQCWAWLPFRYLPSAAGNRILQA